MSIIYVLIPIAMLFVVVAVAVFFWAVKSEQFDDLDRQSVSILFDEDTPQASNSTNHPVNEDSETSQQAPSQQNKVSLSTNKTQPLD